MNYEIINIKKRALGITNSQLAERANITLSTLEKITSGINQNPKLKTLQSIACVIGCKLDDFDDAVVGKQIASDAGLELALKYDRLDAHGKAVAEAVIDLELTRLVSGEESIKEQVVRASDRPAHQGSESAE